MFNSFWGKRRDGKRAAFTLIELLIVVAIIAILAAIAVPNFIEAQTRAKVSRVLADLREMRTAVESYAVDNSKYPRMTWYSAWGDALTISTTTGCEELYGTLVDGLGPTLGTVGCGSFGSLGQAFGSSVTTPISYITTIFRDPFAAGRATDADAVLYTYHNNTNYRQGGMTLPATTGSGIAYIPNPSAIDGLLETFGLYVLWSIGPQGQEGLLAAGNYFWNQYDPTNGTTSLGSVFVSQRETKPVFTQDI